MAKRLPDADAFELARKLAGLKPLGLEVNAAIDILLKGYDTNDHFQRESLLRILERSDHLKHILEIDPNTPPAPQQPTFAKEVETFIPPLPASAQLSDKARKQSETVAHWYKDALAWAIQRSPMTPVHFLQAMLVWLLGLAPARRIGVQLHDMIYTHQYVLIVAESSRYAKTTGMYAVDSLGRAAFPHMYIPHQSSPEGLIEMFAGEPPINFDKLSHADQQLIILGRNVAAQRGMVSDEFSGILQARRKEHMGGHAEFLMRAYDARDSEAYHTRSRGMSIVKKPGPSLLGATTPRALGNSATYENWETGDFARIFMMFRNAPLPYNPNFIAPEPPEELVTTLRALNQLVIQRNRSLDPGDYEEIHAKLSTEARAQYDAYTKAVFYDMLDETLDARLHPNYRRLPIQLMKMATSLAAIDWAQAGGHGVPHITLGHWAIAQEIGEIGRGSLHRLLPVMDETRDARAQGELLTLLKQHTEGLTTREISRKTNKPVQVLRAALDVLIESGLVEELAYTPIGKKRALTLYRAL